VDRCAHRAFVDPIAHSLNKCGRRHAARPAEIGRGRTRRRRFEQIFTAADAAVLARRRNLTPAGKTHRCCRNLGKKRTAQGTGSGKKRATQYMTQSTQDISRRRIRRTPERSSRSGETSRYIAIFRTVLLMERIATEVAPQSRQAGLRCRGNSIRRPGSRKPPLNPPG
jgi:hypothetical protein